MKILSLHGHARNRFRTGAFLSVLVQSILLPLNCLAMAMCFFQAVSGRARIPSCPRISASAVCGFCCRKERHCRWGHQASFRFLLLPEVRRLPFVDPLLQPYIDFCFFKIEFHKAFTALRISFNEDASNEGILISIPALRMIISWLVYTTVRFSSTNSTLFWFCPASSLCW